MGGEVVADHCWEIGQEREVSDMRGERGLEAWEKGLQRVQAGMTLLSSTIPILSSGLITPSSIISASPPPKIYSTNLSSAFSSLYDSLGRVFNDVGDTHNPAIALLHGIPPTRLHIIRPLQPVLPCVRGRRCYISRLTPDGEDAIKMSPSQSQLFTFARGTKEGLLVV